MTIDVPQFLTMRSTLPVIDVRSESEHREGHVPSARNIPLLNDAERIVVGTTYKKKGQADAIMEGFRLVGPRLADLVAEAKKVGDECIVHCWRGGMRSGNFCQFVGMAGLKTHQLKGGYKAYRQFGLEQFEKDYSMLVISGYTGSGKTEILKALRASGEQVVDLEGLANHKGSVFGALGQLPQPTTEQFQNDLFEALLKLDPGRRIWIEDESIAVGKIFLPSPFWKTMGRSPIVSVDVPRDVRLDRLVREYGVADREAFGEALKGITKKLGGQHYNSAVEFLNAGDMHAAIDIILTYYDKAYGNGMARKSDRVRLRSEWNGKDVRGFAGELIQMASKRVPEFV